MKYVYIKKFIQEQEKNVKYVKISEKTKANVRMVINNRKYKNWDKTDETDSTVTDAIQETCGSLQDHHN